jgi:hypothetical protein
MSSMFSTVWSNILFFNSSQYSPTGKIEILDHPEVVRELRILERRPLPDGRIVVDHPSGRHDDHSNSLAIAVSKAKAAVAMHGVASGPTCRNPFGLSTFGPRGDRFWSRKNRIASAGLSR